MRKMINVTGRAGNTNHALKVSGVQCSENTSNIQYSPHAFPHTSVPDLLPAFLLPQLISRHNSREEESKFFSYVIRIKSLLLDFCFNPHVCPVSLAANVSYRMWWYLKIKAQTQPNPTFRFRPGMDDVSVGWLGFGRIELCGGRGREIEKSVMGGGRGGCRWRDILR